MPSLWPWSGARSPSPDCGLQIVESKMKKGVLWIIVLGILMIVLVTGPSLWAAPGQSPGRQTVPTRTSVPPPSPTDLPPSPTDLPPSPTDLPPLPTDLPPSPTDLPPSPTDLPPSPTDLPPSPTDLPSSPTDLPLQPVDQLTPTPTAVVKTTRVGGASGLSLPEAEDICLSPGAALSVAVILVLAVIRRRT